MLDEVQVIEEEKLFLLIASVSQGELILEYQPDPELGDWAVCSDDFQAKVLSGEDLKFGDFCIVQMKDPMVFPFWVCLKTELESAN